MSSDLELAESNNGTENQNKSSTLVSRPLEPGSFHSPRKSNPIREKNDIAVIMHILVYVTVGCLPWKCGYSQFNNIQPQHLDDVKLSYPLKVRYFLYLYILFTDKSL